MLCSRSSCGAISCTAPPLIHPFCTFGSAPPSFPQFRAVGTVHILAFNLWGGIILVPFLSIQPLFYSHCFPLWFFPWKTSRAFPTQTLGINNPQPGASEELTPIKPAGAQILRALFDSTFCFPALKCLVLKPQK